MLVLTSILSHNSRNTPTTDPWDITQSLVDHTHPKQAKPNVCFIKKNRLAFHTSRQAQKASRPPGGEHVRQVPSTFDAIISTSIAWRDNPYLQALHLSILYWFCSHRLAVKRHLQVLHQYLCSIGFSAPRTSKNNPFTFHIYIYIYIYYPS